MLVGLGSIGSSLVRNVLIRSRLSVLGHLTHLAKLRCRLPQCTGPQGYIGAQCNVDGKLIHSSSKDSFHGGPDKCVYAPSVSGEEGYTTVILKKMSQGTAGSSICVAEGTQQVGCTPGSPTAPNAARSS